MSVNTINNNNRSQYSQDPLTEAQYIMDELQQLLQNPQGNQTQILSLESQLKQLVQSNPSAFSNIQSGDIFSFCSDIEDYYMNPTTDSYALGGAMAWFQDAQQDLAQGDSPVIPNIPKSLQQDIYQLIYDFVHNPSAVAGDLAKLQQDDPKNLPPLLEEKIQDILTAGQQYLKDPSDFNFSQTECAAESAWYALREEAPWGGSVAQG